MTRQDAVTARRGQHFYHLKERNRDGTAVRCRVTGSCKTWKTRPDDFKLPVKYGLKHSFYLTPSNAAEWSTEEVHYCVGGRTEKTCHYPLCTCEIPKSRVPQEASHGR